MPPKATALLLLLLAIAPLSLAVPSVTDHGGRHHPAREKTHVRHEPPYQRTLFSRASTKAIDWLWDFFDEEQTTQPSLAKPSRPGPPKRLLAQYGDQLVLRFDLAGIGAGDIKSLEEACDILFLDVWASSAEWVDIRIGKDVVPSLFTLLPPSLQDAHKPLLQGNDLAHAILDTYHSTASSSGPDGFGVRRTSAPSLLQASQVRANVFFNDYQPLGVIYHWIRLLQSLFATHVQLISVGRSYEGRSIEALRVGVHPTNSMAPSAPRKTVVIVAGQHAREWISVSTVNYVAYSIITQYGKSPSITKLLEEVDLVFVPTLNPDGYQYSFDVDRLWRKTRSANELPFCPGVDLDRSWNFEWDGQRTLDNPCSENYAGESPFEAIESRSFAEWARNETLNNNMEIVGLLDLHSYSQEILYPYAFSCGESPPTLEDLMEMGHGLAKAIRIDRGETYKVISACEGSVAGSGKVQPHFGGGGGSLLDWFYHELGVRKSYQIKLRDKGVYGFLVPKEFIVPTGSEILSAVEWFAMELAQSSNMAFTAAQQPAQSPLKEDKAL